MSGDRWRDWTPPNTRRGFAGFEGGSRGVGSQERATRGGAAKGVEPAKPTKLVNPLTCGFPHSLQNDPQNLQNPEDVAKRIPELLARYHLGLVPANVGRRLALIFKHDPPDALERLERAADYLGITGEHADALLDRAAQRGPSPARDYLDDRSTTTRHIAERTAA